MRGRTRTRTPAGGRNSRARAGAGSGDANRCRRTTTAGCRAGWGGPGTPPIRRAGAPPPRRPTPGAIRPVPKVPASPEPTAEEPRPVCDRERRQLAAHGPGAAPTSPASSTRSLCDGSPRAPRTPPTPRPPASIPLPPASPPDATVESAHTSICTAAWGWLLFRLLQPPPGSRREQRFGVALRCRFRRPGVYCVRSVEPSRPVVPGRRGIASILFEVSVPPDSRRLPTPVERGPAARPATGSAPTARRTRNRVATGAVVTARQEAPAPSVFVPARSGVGARSERTGPIQAFASPGGCGYLSPCSYPPPGLSREWRFGVGHFVVAPGPRGFTAYGASSRVGRCPGATEDGVERPTGSPSPAEARREPGRRRCRRHHSPRAPASFVFVPGSVGRRCPERTDRARTGVAQARSDLA